jgi:hypothetical protein
LLNSSHQSHKPCNAAGEQAERARLATFIPPLVLLGLGSALTRVFRGFRARDARS